jgi:hypothetical protein
MLPTHRRQVLILDRGLMLSLVSRPKVRGLCESRFAVKVEAPQAGTPHA